MVEDHSESGFKQLGIAIMINHYGMVIVGYCWYICDQLSADQIG